MYTVDTNAIIYYLKGDASALSFFNTALLKNEPLYVSTVTEAELFGFPALSVAEEEKISALLGSLPGIPITSEMARRAGYLRRTFGLSLPDSIIAATALSMQTTLVTRNVRDFRHVPELHVLKV
jgi:predicted nucleic acid-binding protein